MRKMKDSHLLGVGAIPDDWKVIKTKFVLSYVKRKPQNNSEVITCFRDGTVTRRSNKREEGFTFSDKEIGYQQIHIGDFVFHGMDGFAGAIGVSDSFGKASPVLIVCEQTKGSSNKYYSYYFKNLANNNVFEDAGNGVRVRSCDIRWNKLGNMYVAVPPFLTQQRIADYLDAQCAEIDHSMELVRQGIDKLKEYKKSVITEAVTKGLDPDVPMKDSGVPWIGEIPDGWKLTKIAYGIDYTGSGTTPPSDQPQWYQGDIPWITTSELRESIIYTTNKCVSELTLNTFSALKLYPKGSLIIAMYGATIGRMGFLGIEGTTNQACCVLYGESQLTLKYIFYFIFSLKEIILILGQGSGQPNLTQETIRALRIPAPNISEQKHITAYLDAKCAEIDTLITQKKTLLDKLAEYKKSLIFECVTGKREVAA